MSRLPREYEERRTLQIVWEGHPPRQRVGLALGGGAARGIAHIGVLQVLEKHNVPVDCIAGTSAGAIVGGLYAAGLTPDAMENLMRELSWMEIASFALPKLGLLNFDRIASWIEECLGDLPNSFERLRIPFAAVAADIVTGELVAINSGRLAHALQASSSVPGIFTPTQFNSRLLVDGGILNNLPVTITRRLGADYVIAVDLLPPGTVGGKKPDNVMELTVTAIYMLMRSTHNEGSLADRVILPQIGHINLADLSKVDELLQAGRAATEKIIPQIENDLQLL